LLIQHSKYSVVKNTLLQTAFLAILPTGYVMFLMIFTIVVVKDFNVFILY